MVPSRSGPAAAAPRVGGGARPAGLRTSSPTGPRGGCGRLRWDAVSAETPGPFAGRRILVVDDTEELAEILTFVLTREGAHVEVATDGLSAVERATGDGFDVVLMDVGLPGIDGLEACRRITAARDDVAVVMLSAREAAADREAGRTAGATGYLAKPFTPRRLVADLAQLLDAAGRADHAGG